MPPHAEDPAKASAAPAEVASAAPAAAAPATGESKKHNKNPDYPRQLELAQKVCSIQLPDCVPPLNFRIGESVTRNEALLRAAM